ncbi:hypothetical protein SAMN05443667_11464 [Flavobacterium gillisiae]|uniref:Uncharacterized protein n=1 Tax=Flavobacterium gillisiae TaxID=150146 RepID=A0A1H4FNT8_9FLAO|nr:hypothetical protein [Flavobacterium gillisiae]SEA98945.1 hypothetical protein SAMN05443667_11464 [Flavobacterium gillisiae]
MNIIDSIFKLLRIRESDENIFLLLEKSKEDYLIIIKNIEEILREGKNNAQANVVEKISEILIEKDFPKFKKEINSVDMWGGSGAVWEVYFHNENLQRKFNNQMLKLIDLMERTKIIGRGIKPLKKLFRR